ncbi:hypothetical protein A9Q83_04605 [Alphaproteobacteria bacterium 46_93_T64]|nr:hypothetical protein A9Q83_04605 [Alphaproteobacteria bacterium 46_93_T64]
MGNECKVLIVDDSKLARIMLQRAISVYNPEWSIAQAANGEEGLIAFEEDKPDIILVDYHMPGINGIELAQKFRDKDKTIPIALCTANIQNTIQEQAEGIGISFVAKPITNDAVAEFLKVADKARMEKPQ